MLHCLCWGLWPVQPNGSCQAPSVYLTKHLLGRLSPLLKQLTSIVHIISPETDNCPSRISGREIMTAENISWWIQEKCCRPGGGRNLQPPDHQLDVHPTWATEASLHVTYIYGKCLKIPHFLAYILSLFLKILSEMAKTVDPDQTAPLGSVWSESALFAYAIFILKLWCTNM